MVAIHQHTHTNTHTHFKKKSLLKRYCRNDRNYSEAVMVSGVIGLSLFSGVKKALDSLTVFQVVSDGVAAIASFPPQNFLTSALNLLACGLKCKDRRGRGEKHPLFIHLFEGGGGFRKL